MSKQVCPDCGGKGHEIFGPRDKNCLTCRGTGEAPPPVKKS